ncbi:MAG: hypothetical protein ACTSRL_14650, partial [Candidatus Helarchaeota archaeon]
MSKGLSKKEIKRLRAEREALLAQATEFLESDDYELLSDLFTEIAALSEELGEIEIAKDFSQRAEQIHALLLSPDAPLEPEIQVEAPSESTSYVSPPKISPSTPPLSQLSQSFPPTPSRQMSPPQAPPTPPQAPPTPPQAPPTP